MDFFDQLENKSKIKNRMMILKIKKGNQSKINIIFIYTKDKFSLINI